MKKKEWFSPVYDPQTSSSTDRVNEIRPLRIVRAVDADGVPEESRLAASIFAAMLYPGDSDEDVSSRVGTSNVLGLGFRAWRTGDQSLELADLAGELIASRAQIFGVLLFIRHSSWTAVFERWHQGLIAGQVLHALVEMNTANPGTASLEKAFFLVEKFIEEQSQSNLDEKRSAGLSTIKKCWAMYRTVSPWWAGLRDFTDTLAMVMKEKDDGQSRYRDVRHVALESVLHSPGHLILRATNYTRLATQVVPKNSRNSASVLPWYETWLAPLESIPVERPDFLDPSKVPTWRQEEVKAIIAEYRDRRHRTTLSK